MYLLTYDRVLPILALIATAILIIGCDQTQEHRGSRTLEIPTEERSLALTYNPITAVYTGGAFYYSEGAPEELKGSGFSNVIIWTIHVEDDGSLNFNGRSSFPLVNSEGYIGDQKYPEFQNQVASLTQGETNIKRVEMGLSAWKSKTYDNIKSLVLCQDEGCGVGEDSILYQNFKVLRETFPNVVAINNDDEGTYDLETSLKFHQMLHKIGFQTSIAPYTNKAYWQSFVTEMNNEAPGSVDLAYLQVYAGGKSNDPCEWDLGIPLIGGTATDDGLTAITDVMSEWQGCNIVGGFLWNFDKFEEASNLYVDSIIDGFR